ncbi:COG1470 family protein [Geoglobus acetivorans]|uniref:Uncharacterized protein n=1 Tax=Geoglobus acetivorans TaxID=565033 RepID=A0A0A7GFC6_GEOAI|nr:hypothetical protein, conserved, DUF1102 family [Geoglobus acetivorans]
MKTYINLLILLTLSFGLLVGSSSHFKEFGAERNFSANVTELNESLISCLCPENKTRYLKSGDTFTLLNITNRLGEEATFYVYTDSSSINHESEFFLSPNESVEVKATFYGLPGFYSITARVSADWANGSAELYACTINISSPRLEIEKHLMSGKESVKVGEKEYWTFRILVKNPGTSDDFVIKDTVPAELEILEISPSSGSYEILSNGMGNSGSSTITWYVHLENGDVEWLDVNVTTKQNPACRQEFTSPGAYCLNDGAEVVGYDIRSNPICITVYSDCDSGKCDEKCCDSDGCCDEDCDGYDGCNDSHNCHNESCDSDGCCYENHECQDGNGSKEKRRGHRS